LSIRDHLHTTAPAAAGHAEPLTQSFLQTPAGNLASVAIPATGSSPAETVDYTSNGDGVRQSRTVGSTTTNFLWSTGGSLPLLLDDGTYSYLYGPSSAPIAEINDSTGTIRYLSDDLIGSTRLITSSTGTVVGVNIYDEYGNATTHAGTASSPIGYSGNWTDPDTGLVYLRARDYDPANAQFLTVDPLVDQTRQPYAYVADDPLTGTDPTGCDFWNDPLDALAHGLMSGPGADVASVLEGIGDGASFGLTQSVRQAMGTDCEVQKNGFYFAGLIGGAVASTIVTAGFGAEGDVADGAEVAEDGASDLTTAGEDTAESGAEDAGEGAEETADDSDMCAAQSFTPDTNVVLAVGKTVPISAVKLGQKVKDVNITNAAGVSSTIHTTDRHPFWDVTTLSWVDADNLKPGDQLQTDNGTTATFTNSVVVTGSANMWDLTIAGVHDFYITTGETSILVHNNSDSCDLDKLSELGKSPAKNGFSKAGRALQKHSNGPGRSGIFDAIAQSPKLLNPQGEAALDDILTDPEGTTVVGDNVIDIFGAAGRGARFRADLSEFMGFLEK
jgi:RHS repeat-associated protein